MALSERVVVVTGASSGIGRAIATGLANRGARVVGFGRTESDLKATVAASPDRMSYVVGDVRLAEDVERLFGNVEERHGRCDVLFNNAALYPKQHFLESDMDEWARTIEVNVIGMARCCHRALPGMLERGYGRVINVGSFAWMSPIPTASAYSASKGAVTPLTRGIAGEISSERYPDVLVNELVPGIYRTRMTPDQGEDPSAVIPHALHLVELPAGGPHGQTFLKSEIHQREPQGLRSNLTRLAGRIRARF